MREKKNPFDKVKEEAQYNKLSKRDRDLLLVYEDKTYILFNERRKPKER